MRLKKILHTMNRGVLLAILLIFIMVIYTTIDTFTFKTETDSIRSTIETYIGEFETSQVATDTYLATKSWTSDAITAQKQQYLDLLDKYFTTTSYTQSAVSSYLYEGQSDLTSELDYFYSDFEKDTGYISDIDYTISDFSIHKNGPNGAIASFTLDTTYTTYGTTDKMGASYDNNYIYDEIDLEDASDDTKTTGLETQLQNSTSEDVSIQLLREDGSWKIAYIGSTFTGTEYGEMEE